MSIQKLSFFMLGLALAALPARATINYNATTQSAFNTQITTDLLTASSLITFTSADLVSSSEYVDLLTGIEFFVFKSDGSTPDTLTVNGSNALLTGTGGDIIQVVFTTPDTYALGFNFNSVAFDFLCVDISFPGPCNSGGTANPGFISAFNEGPVAPLPTLFIHPQSGSPATQLVSFEAGTQSGSATPEVSTMLLLGSGLLAIALTRKKRAHEC